MHAHTNRTAGQGCRSYISSAVALSTHATPCAYLFFVEARPRPHGAAVVSPVVDPAGYHTLRVNEGDPLLLALALLALALLALLALALAAAAAAAVTAAAAQRLGCCRNRGRSFLLLLLLLLLHFAYGCGLREHTKHADHELRPVLCLAAADNDCGRRQAVLDRHGATTDDTFDIQHLGT
jgi:hypothetical protein